MVIGTEADMDDPVEPLPVAAFRRSTLRSLDVAEAESHLPPWTRELLACLGTRARTAFVLRQAGMTHAQIGLHRLVRSASGKCADHAREERAAAFAREVLPQLRDRLPTGGG